VGKRAGDDLVERSPRCLLAPQSGAARFLERRRGRNRQFRLAADDASRRCRPHREANGPGLANPEPGNGHRGYRNLDGEFRTLSTEALPRFSDSGEFLGMIGVNLDLTERINAERALAANEARLKRAHTAGGIGDWEIDLETSELVWSDSQYALLGVPRTAGPLSRAAFDDRIHPDDRPDVARVVAESLESGRFETEFRVLLADGRYHWLAARGEVHRDATGKPKRMTGINFDVTAEREAREQQKLLIDELNHRVKNTLAMVQSFASLTLKTATPEEFR